MEELHAYSTLGLATLAAIEQARQRGDQRYVIEQVTDLTAIQRGISTPLPIPTQDVTFMVASKAILVMSLRLEHPPTGITFTLLRLALPDGSVSAISDPGTYPERLRLLEQGAA